MRWLPLVFMPGVLFAQGEIPEEMHGAFGASFSASPGERDMGTAWITNFGSRLWITERMGLRFDLSYQRFGLSDQMRSQIPSGVNGCTEITSATLSGVIRFSSGFYLQSGYGIYRRAVVPASSEGHPDLPSHTRGGWNGGIGWEFQSGVFVEVSFHRMETPGGPTDMVPVLFGSRF